MRWYLGPYQVALLAIALWMAALSVAAARRRTLLGALPLSRLSLAVAGWALGFCGELMATGLEAKVVWSCLTYTAIAIVPVAWLLFCLGYTGDARWTSPRRQVLLIAVPSLTVALAWTNAAHGLMWRDATLVQYGDLLLMKVVHGPAFWLHAAYSYLLTMLGVVVAARAAIKSSRLYRRQALVLLAASAPPILVNVGRVAGLRLLGPLDWSPFAFALSASVLTWALLRLRFFDVLPVAQDAIVRIMSDGVVVLDDAGLILDINPAARGMLGLVAPRVFGTALADVLPQAAALLSATPGVDRRAELVLQDAPSARHVEIHLSPILQRGVPLGQLLVLRDVSERKRQETALAESEARYRDIVQDETELICRLQPDGSLAFVNDALCRYFGASREELIGHSLLPYVYSDDREENARSLESFSPERPTALLEHRVVLPGGEVRWLQWTSRAVYDEAGQILRYQSVGRDVTDRRLAEEGLQLARQELEQRVVQRTADLAQANRALEVEAAEREQVALELRKSEERFRALFTAGSDAIFVQAVDDGPLPHRFSEVNDVACQRLGYSREELLRLSMADVDPIDREKELPAVVAQLRATGYALFETWHLTKGGQAIPVEVSARLFELDGQPTVISIARDVSERRRLQEQILRSQKMETLGRLAGGVAHDFNNLLTVISGHAGFARESIPAGDPAQDDIEQVLRASELAANLTQQLLAFSRHQVIEPKLVRLNQVILDTRRMLQRVIGEDIELTTRLEPGSDWVRVDPGQIEQVLVNLAVNARDAMPRGGRLELATDYVGAEEAGYERPGGGAAGAYVRLSVTDTGVGMTEDVRSHAFEPFYTTKPMGRGTGLGLATVYGVVEQHHGRIDVESMPGHGTTFSILLPLLSESEAEAQQPAAPDACAGGDETILLVEDEPAVRDVAQRALRAAGYNVVAAGSAKEALALAQARRGTLQLLLTDVVMPGVGGRDLAAALQQIDPGLRVLFTSGYTKDHAALQAALRPGVAFLHKPFTAEALCRHVREVLDDSDVQMDA